MAEQDNPVPYFGRDLNAALGIVVDNVGDGVATGTMPIADAVRQPYGVVHGGAHAAFAETLASAGTYAAVAPEGKIALGMTNNTQFLRAATEGTVHGEAVAIHRGRTTWVWDAELKDDDGRLLAVSRLTIAVRDAR
ncbi:MAG: PaaI family thioesterase [Actinobacteria bacterium]|nr:PaaI family thioesterase [Actinomycetota bacterium]